MLYESPALEALRPTPREAYVRTLLGAVEMLRTGTTAVQDDAFFVPDGLTYNPYYHTLDRVFSSFPEIVYAGSSPIAIAKAVQRATEAVRAATAALQ